MGTRRGKGREPTYEEDHDYDLECIGVGVPWRHPSGKDGQEVGILCIEFIEAVWAGV